MDLLKEKNKRDRKKFASKGIREFGETYFPEYFTLQVPEVHKAIYKDLEDIVREVCEEGHHYSVAIPRGCAKSTILDFLYPLYCVCFNLKRYILVISASQDLANTFLGLMKEELEHNQLLVEDFGLLKGDTWNAETFTTTTGIKVQALGSGTKIRGLRNASFRPDLIIMDDLEEDEGVRSPEQRKKLKDWYYKAVSKVGTKSTDFIFLGTVLHYDSLLMNVLSNPSYKTKKYSAVIKFAEDVEHWAEWEKILTNLDNENRLADAKAYFNLNQDIMLKGTEVLWEQKYSYYDLMVMKVTEGDASFNTEMQNNPINPESAIFSRQWFKYFKVDDIKKEFKDIDLYGSVDASMGKKNTSDPSAIIILGRNRRTGQMYVFEANIKVRHPDQIIEDVAVICEYWQTLLGKRFQAFGVEDIAFQAFFKDTLRKELMKKGVYLNIIGQHSNQDKQLRIEKLQPDIKNGYIKFQTDQRVLLEQLEFFPLAGHDDGPDALEMARRLVGRSITV